MGALQGTLDDRVDETPGAVVDADEHLACDCAVEERHDPGAVLEAGVDDETGRQALVYGTEVAQRVPDLVRRSVDQDLLGDGSHGVFSLGGLVSAGADGPAE